MAALPRRSGDDRITGEQAALRRVATLVASGAPPEEVFAAVTEEAGRLLRADNALMCRYDPDGYITVVGRWSRSGAAFPVGTQHKLGGKNLHTVVFQTGRPARINDYADAWGPEAQAARESGVRAAVGVPVSVEGRLWGVLMVASLAGPLPAGTESQLAGFTELAATAIANAQARAELRGFAEEQAALRRVATLVAQGASPEKVFAAVAREGGQLLLADHAVMVRYGPGDALSLVATWTRTGVAYPVGVQVSLGGQDVPTMVFQTRQPARIDDYSGASGPVGELVCKFGVCASVGVPVSVGGRLWGCMTVESRAGPLPAGTETRLAAFTELAATAIANCEAQAALTASRARIVATADATRRRIERNLHDGAQQRLVCLALNLRTAEAAAAAGTADLVPELHQLAVGLDGALAELREIASGLHPAILAEGGLAPALNTLARRSVVPVNCDTKVDRRLPDAIEIAAYYTVAEALTNAAKHAHATGVQVAVTTGDGVLRVRVQDNGCGGADFSHGSGLVGLRDRVEALGGQLRLDSPAGAGTTLEITLPLDQPGEPELPPGAEGVPGDTRNGRGATTPGKQSPQIPRSAG